MNKELKEKLKGLFEVEFYKTFFKKSFNTTNSVANLIGFVDTHFIPREDAVSKERIREEIEKLEEDYMDTAQNNNATWYESKINDLNIKIKLLTNLLNESNE